MAPKNGSCIVHCRPLLFAMSITFKVDWKEGKLFYKVLVLSSIFIASPLYNKDYAFWTFFWKKL